MAGIIGCAIGAVTMAIIWIITTSVSPDEKKEEEKEILVPEDFTRLTSGEAMVIDWKNSSITLGCPVCKRRVNMSFHVHRNKLIMKAYKYDEEKEDE